MLRPRARLLMLVSWVALACATACMTDHDALEKKPNQVAGAGGTGGGAGVAGQAPTAGTGNGTAGSGHPDDEAPGTSVLTFVNGVVDAPSVDLCFAKVTSDGVVPFGAPQSKSPLAYGDSLVLPTIAGADPAADVLEPFVIAGDLALIAGLDCAAAVERARAEEAAANPVPESGGAAGASAEGGSPGEAGAFALGSGGASSEVTPQLRVRALAAIPAGTLNGGRSYLAVASGCLGGATYSVAKTGAAAIDAEDYCGTGYTEQNPTVTLIFAALSRAVDGSHVGLQLLHASLPTDPISIDSVPAFPSTDTAITIASGDVAGGLAPRPAYLDHTAFDYGADRGFGLSVIARRKVPMKTGLQDITLLTENWAEVLVRGGITTLENGSNYTLLLLGPLADSKPGPAFWNRPVLTVVPSDPK